MVGNINREGRVNILMDGGYIMMGGVLGGGRYNIACRIHCLREGKPERTVGELQEGLTVNENRLREYCILYNTIPG